MVEFLTVVILLLWGGLGYGCYRLAQQKNRNAPLWFVLGVLFGLLALLILALLRAVPKGDQ